MNAKELLAKVTETLVRNGGEVTIGHDIVLNVLTYDLNVGFKSGIKLHIEDDKLIARMRYDGREEINCIKDLLDIYDYWFEDAQGRGWGKMTVADGWAVLYEGENIIPPVHHV